MAAIFVIKLSALGDLVQADGALHDLREHHSGDRITVMTSPAYHRYMERCPWVDEVFVDPRESRFNLAGMYALRKRLRDQPMDRVYDLQQVGRTRFYRRWLFPEVPWLGDAPGCTYYRRRPAGSCAADHFAHHLRLAGIEPHHTCNVDISWLATDVTGILHRAEVQPGFVVLIPGASTSHDEKRWPYFSELANRLQALGRQVVTVPGPSEHALCRSISGKMLAPDDGGFYDVFRLAGIIKHAAFVVGNDTGPTHIAAHLGGAGLALFGSHVPATSTGIQHTRFRWLQAEQLATVSVESVWRRIVADVLPAVA